MSSDTTINSDRELDLPPVSYGGNVGDSVCKTIVKNIKIGKYVNFGDLLPDRSEPDTKSDIFVKIGDKGTPQFEKRGKTRILTFTEWSEAFDIFMMINIDIQCSKNKDTKSLLKDMLTYRKHVMSMMKDGGDWREYDKHFWKLMEVQPVSWSTANFNLIWHYNIRNNLPKNTTTSTVTTNATSANNSELQKNHAICLTRQMFVVHVHLTHADFNTNAWIADQSIIQNTCVIHVRRLTAGLLLLVKCRISGLGLLVLNTHTLVPKRVWLVVRKHQG